MSTFTTIMAQVNNLITQSNNTTGSADSDLTTAVSTLISGYGGGTVRKYSGTFKSTSSQTSVTHNCNCNKYLLFCSVDDISKATDTALKTRNLIGYFDINGVSFNGSIYNSISAGARITPSTGVSNITAWNSNTSTPNVYIYGGNAFPNNVDMSWVLYDLSDF